MSKDEDGSASYLLTTLILNCHNGGLIPQVCSVTTKDQPLTKLASLYIKDIVQTSLSE
jgi:hypothetical protein